MIQNPDDTPSTIPSLESVGLNGIRKEWKVAEASSKPHFFVYSSKTPLQLAKTRRDLQTEEEKSCFDKLENYILSDEFMKDIEKGFSDSFKKSCCGEVIRIDLSGVSSEWDIVDDQGLIVDAFSIIRFLNARKFDFSAAKQLLTETVTWRLEKKPHLITKEEVQNEIRKEKGVWHGYSTQNNPVIFINPQNHVTYDRDFEECINFTLYMGELGMKMVREVNQQKVLPLLATESVESVLEKYVEQYVIVYDGRAIAMKNCDVVIIKEFLRISNYYAERLNSVVVYNPNWTYKILLKMVSPFIDKKTSDKIKVAYDINEVADFLDIDNVPTQFGGNCTINFTGEN